MQLVVCNPVFLRYFTSAFERLDAPPFSVVIGFGVRGDVGVAIRPILRDSVELKFTKTRNWPLWIAFHNAGAIM